MSPKVSNCYDKLNKPKSFILPQIPKTKKKKKKKKKKLRIPSQKRNNVSSIATGIYERLIPS